MPNPNFPITDRRIAGTAVNDLLRARCAEYRDEQYRCGASGFVYALCEPDTPKRVIRYVGSSGQPVDRYRQHVLTAHHRKSPVARWVDGLIDGGKLPVLFLVAFVGTPRNSFSLRFVKSRLAAVEIERQLIEELDEAWLNGDRRWGELLNIKHTHKDRKRRQLPV